MHQAQTLHAVLGASLAVALKRHRQDHADVIGEAGGMVHERQRQPCPVSERRVADHGMAMAVRGRVPAEEVGAHDVGAQRQDVDSDATGWRQEIIERAGAGARLDECVVLQPRTVPRHPPQKGLVTPLGDGSAREELIETHRFDIDPGGDVRIGAPAPVALETRQSRVKHGNAKASRMGVCRSCPTPRRARRSGDWPSRAGHSASCGRLPSHPCGPRCLPSHTPRRGPGRYHDRRARQTGIRRPAHDHLCIICSYPIPPPATSAIRRPARAAREGRRRHPAFLASSASSARCGMPCAEADSRFENPSS